MTRIGEWSAALVGDQLELYRRMWVLRLLDMKLAELRIDGLIEGPRRAGFGQEAVSIGASAALREGDITTTTTYRPHAHRVGLGLPLGPTIADLVGRTDRQDASKVIADLPRLRLRSGVLEQPPSVAVGYAYSQWLADEGRVTLCVTADRDVDSADFIGAVDMAVSLRLPIVILVENIRYAPSVPQGSHLQETSLYRRAAGYGMPAATVDGNDVEAVRDAVAKAVQRASVGEGPTLVEAVTYRTTVVSESEQLLDPLIVARRRLIDAGVTLGHLYEVERAARHLVDEAFAIAMPRVEYMASVTAGISAVAS
jgi:TPP-dependent pyruvate/acetoin dehydrogenase alpha subunit